MTQVKPCHCLITHMHLSNFRVGTFNLYNLVLPNTVYYDRQKYSVQDYNRKVRWLGGQLDRMQADIIGFQELFHPPALEAVVNQSDYLKGCKIAAAQPSETGPGVAIASRLPILEYHSIEDFPEAAWLDIEEAEIPLRKFSRPVLLARLLLREGLECMVLVAHLKSKRPILPEDVDRQDPVELAKGQARALIRRAAEATALRAVLMEVLQDRNFPVIALGDLNDNGMAVTTQMIAGEPPWYKQPLEQRKKVWDVHLYQVKDIQARLGYGDFYYTHLHNGHHEALDHILVSQEFVAQYPNRIGRVSYVSVFNDHLVDETISRQGVAKWQSDHGQVVAAIELEG